MSGDKGRDMETEKQNVAPKFTDLAQLTHNNGVKIDAVVSLLGAIADSNDVICDYKEQQKKGDITFRRKADRSNKHSIALSVVSVVIASTALAISLESSFIMAFIAAFK